MNKLYHIFFFLLLSYSLTTFAELRDPTRPNDLSFLPGAETGSLEVNAIILSDQRQRAVINGVIVKIGDQVFGRKIIGIDANSVHLEGVNGRMSLFLVKQPVKKQVNTNSR
jgi:hypothetical protein